MYSSTLCLTLALNGGGWLTPRPIALLPGKARYPTYMRLVGPQGRSGQVQKISPPTGILFPDHLARSESLYYTYSILSLKFGTKNTGEIRRDNNMKTYFKETGWEVVCSNSEI